MTGNVPDTGAMTNERSSLYGCKFCPALGREMKVSQAVIDGTHNQNRYRAMRGHCVECRSKVLASGATPADVTAAPLKLCGYCRQSFSDAHIAGDHSLTCADGPALKAAAEAAAAPAKTAKPRRRKVGKKAKGRRAKAKK